MLLSFIVQYMNLECQAQYSRLFSQTVVDNQA